MNTLKKRHKITKLLIFSMLGALAVGIAFMNPSISVKADEPKERADEIINTYNCPGQKDYRHYVYFRGQGKTYIARQITEWVKRDPRNPIEITYQEAVSGTINYQIGSSGGIEIALMDKLLSASSQVNKSLSFSYSASTMRAYKWTINPTDPGNFYCIALNYKTRKLEIMHYKQKFKLFGQGNYIYQSTSTVYTPTEKYLTKNFRYEIDGATYEMGN